MSIEENKRVIQNLISGINQNDKNIMDECLADNFIRYAADIQQMDKEGYINFCSFLKASSPDFHAIIDDIVAEDDKVGFRFTWTVTNQDDTLGDAYKGKQFKITEDYFCRLEKGKIVEFKNLVDRLDVYQQMGLLPPTEEMRK